MSSSYYGYDGPDESVAGDGARDWRIWFYGFVSGACAAVIVVVLA